MTRNTASIALKVLARKLQAMQQGIGSWHGFNGQNKTSDLAALLQTDTTVKVLFPNEQNSPHRSTLFISPHQSAPPDKVLAAGPGNNRSPGE